jgi:AraC-like DNA-binding protein
MQRIRFVKPAPGLKDVVRCYVQREAVAQDADLIHPVPARAAPILEFVLSDLFEIHWCDRPLIETTPRTVIVGLQTHRRVRLRTRGTLESFCVVFQPAGLFRLFSIRSDELTNHDYEARAVMGPWVSQVHERLGECVSLEERGRITDDALLRLCLAQPGWDGVSSAANEILIRHGEVRIGDLAEKAGLSVRQFERRFNHQVGMRPKLYARIARFEAALESKARSRAKSWTEVAHELAYHDQMHLVHDFEQFSGETPTNVLTELEKAHQAFIDAIRLGRISANERDAARLFL